MAMDNKSYERPWFFKSIFEAAPAAISFVDAEGFLIDCNSKMEDLIGYKKEEITGEHFQKWIHPDYHDKGQSNLNLLMEDNISHSVEYRFVKKDGQIIDVSVDSTSMRDKNNNFTHTICYLTDVTENKKSGIALEELAKELKKSNLELEQFAYVASHDLQEPLRVVSSYCQLLKEKHYSHMDEDGRKYIDYAIDATLRMKILIKELLDFSRVGRKDEPFEEVKISDIIKEVLSDYEMAIDETEAEIIIENGDLPVICAIRFRIKQLLSNLLSNALKFHSDKKPIIRIGCCDEDDNWLFYVKDNGIGIESQYFDRIFGIFKRLYSRDEYPGTGIGLALCKRIVETHGGKIWVDSDADEGTWIYFTISKNIGVV